MNIKLSMGSAIHLGLRRAKLTVDSSTVYTMLGERCLGGCRFCTQSRTSNANRKFLSRVTWPSFELDQVLDGIDQTEDIMRICIQTLKYPDLYSELLSIIEHVKDVSSAPISICMNPLEREQLVGLKQAGVERVGVGLDCATRETFEKIKPGYSWLRYLRFIEDVVNVFGIGSVHLIVGLGDTDQALLKLIQNLRDKQACVALFAFTPVKGTDLAFSPPPVERYRALQLARYLIVHQLATFDDMIFRDGVLKSIAISTSTLESVVESGQPFETSGCPDCNRPLYNERPGGVMYNFPTSLTADQKEQVAVELDQYLSA